MLPSKFFREPVPEVPFLGVLLEKDTSKPITDDRLDEFLERLDDVVETEGPVWFNIDSDTKELKMHDRPVILRGEHVKMVGGAAAREMFILPRAGQAAEDVDVRLSA